MTRCCWVQRGDTNINAATRKKGASRCRRPAVVPCARRRRVLLRHPHDDHPVSHTLYCRVLAVVIDTHASVRNLFPHRAEADSRRHKRHPRREGRGRACNAAEERKPSSVQGYLDAATRQCALRGCISTTLHVHQLRAAPPARPRCSRARTRPEAHPSTPQAAAARRPAAAAPGEWTGQNRHVTRIAASSAHLQPSCCWRKHAQRRPAVHGQQTGGGADGSGLGLT